jgi:hypothetical protein
VGNSIASAVVAKWEGALLSEDEANSRLQSIEAEAEQPAHALAG